MSINIVFNIVLGLEHWYLKRLYAYIRNSSKALLGTNGILHLDNAWVGQNPVVNTLTVRSRACKYC